MQARQAFCLPGWGISSSLRILYWSGTTQPLGHRRVHHTASGELCPSPVQEKMGRPFDQLPGHWRNSWLNLYNFWKEDGFHNLHNIMVKKFQQFGPIYREKLGTYESVNIIDPKDAAVVFKAEGMYPERFMVPPWMAYRDFRNKAYGVLLKHLGDSDPFLTFRGEGQELLDFLSMLFANTYRKAKSGEDWRHDRLAMNKEALALKMTNHFVPLLNEVGEDFVRRVQMQIQKSGQGRWTADLSNELFRFALESVCNVLYGTRLGLLQDVIDPESQQFIDAVTLMFHTTLPMLYLPPSLLRRINSKIWLDHVKAWDIIFQQADKCIQNIYRDLRLKRRSDQEYTGILSSLLLQNKLPLEDMKASITEMMAGGVDTTSMTLQWAMYELARAPAQQEQLRSEILAARSSSQGDVLKMLKSVPLLKATIKETLRLHPVAVTLQRYLVQDIIIQNYCIPAKTLVQVGLYAMGRHPRYFSKPEQFNPHRWLQEDSSTYFRGLGFGFGPRQCLGRRIAELEMQLFLIQLLQSFKIETKRGVDINTTFNLILVPDKPIHLTLRPLDPQQ